MRKEHILVIRFSALGDVAMAVPVVYSLARQYPDTRITVLSRNFARELFENLAPNVSFMGADLKVEYHGIRGLNALYRRLSAKQFTAVADLHNVLRSGYLRMRFNIGHYRVAHIDKHRSGRRHITAARRKRLTQQPTSFENYTEVFRKLGYPVDIRFHSIFDNTPTGRGDLMLLPEPLRRQIEQHSPQLIGIAPLAAHQGKTYPPELMRQVVDELIQKYPGALILLFGRGPAESALFSQWCRQLPQCVYVAAQLDSIFQELVLMSHLSVMVSMDSSNMHLASLTATTVVSVWGATHPYAGFMGWGQSPDNVIQVPLPCRPCSIFGQKPCRRGDFACMQTIPPHTIVERIQQVLDSKQSL